MTKRELVIQVAEKIGMTQHEVANIVQEMFDTVTDTLVEGNRIEIRNFGVFEVKKRDARVGRNPRTGKEVPIPQKRVAFFKPGKVLKKMVQDNSHDRAESVNSGGDLPSLESEKETPSPTTVKAPVSEVGDPSTNEQQNLF